MSILFIICAMMLTAGAAVRLVAEIDRENPRPIVMVWKTLELVALAFIFNYLA